jgi:N-methylhydantoinase A
MKSTGGLMTFKAVDRRAVETALSGPAAGTIAASYLGGLIGRRRLISFDMGGTSTDVSLIVDGKPRVTTDGRIGPYPIKVPMIDIRTIGAGGGSVAWLDAAQILHVGPRSAGADPGPACYGRQHDDPTVTDANLCLGRLDPAYFLGGSMPLDSQAAHRTITQRIAAPLGWDAQRAAQGIIDIVNSNMARAIREVSVAAGFDAREFALLTFGGAGALHACSLAEELDIPEVIVPEDAGLLSARGLLAADIRAEHSRTRVSPLAGTRFADIEAVFEELEASARSEFDEQGIDTGTCAVERFLDIRYVGQAYEVTVLEPIGDDDDVAPLARWASAFHGLHERLYWWSDADRPTEIVGLRTVATVPVRKVVPPCQLPGPADAHAAVKGQRSVSFAGVGGQRDAPVYDRQRLWPGHVFSGPCIVESFDTTILIPPGHRATVDAYRNIVIRTPGGHMDGD